MSDEEFVRMTEDCDKDIAELQRKIKTLSQSSKTETQLKRELANIKGILKSAEQHIDGEEIDKAFIDRYIDKIIVHPDEDVTRFEIHLTSGLQVEKLLNTITSRAGHNSKKMIKSYEESMR